MFNLSGRYNDYKQTYRSEQHNSKIYEAKPKIIDRKNIQFNNNSWRLQYVLSIIDNYTEDQQKTRRLNNYE